MAESLDIPSAFWPHQREALENIYAYLSSSDVDSKACLTTMPTGTGKTGVIAGAVALLPALEGHRLVLTPWDALVHQLIRDLKTRFWDKVGEHPEQIPEIKRLPTSSQISDIQDAGEPTVYVATIAAISVLERRSEELELDLKKLFDDFDFVIVDEGHYEPAHQWSQAIRSLDLPTLLLTATPYRNDHNLFPPTDGYRYRFTHYKAVGSSYLRAPSFERIDERDPDEYVAALRNKLKERFAETPRVIIRCETSGQIRQIVKALENVGERVVGIHHTFDESTNLTSKVPDNPDEREEDFWVHQRKLIEGIDDPRFKVLAFYEPLRNDRALIQQIGRVLRNPGQDPDDMYALVVDNNVPTARRCWNAYQLFDKQDETESVATHSELVAQILDAQPDVFYFDGAYRTSIDFDSPEAWKEFAYKLRTRVFRSPKGRSVPLMDLATAIASEWKEKDREVFLIQQPEPHTVIIPYLVAENSDWMLRGTFVEAEFGYTLLRATEGVLYVTDTRDSMPQAVKGGFATFAPSELQQLFPDGVSTLRSVSLINTDVGRQAARARSVRAFSIDELAPELGEYAYVCSVADGYTEVYGTPTGRYVGMSRGRVSDRRATDRTYEDFSGWLDTLDKQLAEPAEAAQSFNRYAQVVPPPADPTPVHVLVDVDTSEFFTQIGETLKPLEIHDLAVAVEDSRFQLEVGRDDPVTHECEITWSPDSRKYEISSDTLRDANYWRSSGGEREELIEAINDDQALRVVPAPKNLVYSHGSFFKPTLPSTRAGTFQLKAILHTDSAFADATSEKGQQLAGDDWAPDSVFGLVSALGAVGREAPEGMAALFPEPDLVFCSDLGTEVADFIVTQGGRVAFIHAKASKDTRKYSASALQEVAGQATKNLRYLQPYETEEPDKTRWPHPWKHPKTGERAPRQRVGAFESMPELWRHVRSVIANPENDREVWIVLGNSLSKAEFARQMNKRPPAAEALQLYTLLNATWGAVAQIGARLRVFCSP